MKATNRRRPRKKLGEIDNNAKFTQGGNQAQTFLLIVLVAIIIIFLTTNFTNIANKVLGKDDENKEPPKPTPDPNKNNQNTQVTTTTTTKTGKDEPSLPTVVHTLQWLLTEAGYNTLGIDGSYGTNTNSALIRFANANNLSYALNNSAYSTNFWNDEVRKYLRAKGVLNGTGLKALPAPRKKLKLA